MDCGWWSILRRAAFALLTLAPGCTISPLTFQAIDGDTKQPLPGVAVQQYNLPNLLLIPEFGPPRRNYYVVCPATDAKGKVRTQPLDTYHYEVFFAFKKKGYENSHAGVPHTVKQEVYISTPNPEDGNFTTDLNSTIAVPMYRVGSPSVPLTTEPTEIYEFEK
jgi:hypothetical protein